METLATLRGDIFHHSRWYTDSANAQMHFEAGKTISELNKIQYV